MEPPLTVYVKVQNLGTQAETFSVTSYYGNSKIGFDRKTVTLDAGDSQILDMLWDTAGVFPNMYPIGAYTTLSTDTNATNNDLKDGTIEVAGLPYPPFNVAAFLTETMKSPKRDGVRVERVSENQIEEIFRSIDSGELVKESMPEIVRWLSEHENKSVEEAVTDTGLKMITREELERTVDEVLKANEDLVEEIGVNALGALMSAMMKKVRGRAEAEIVSKLLRERLKAQDSRKTR